MPISRVLNKGFLECYDDFLVVLKLINVIKNIPILMLFLHGPFCGTDSSFVPPLVYSVFGSSRDIAIGPVAVVSLLLGTLLKQEISPTDNPEDYLKLAFTATFFCGVFQTALGVFR